MLASLAFSVWGAFTWGLWYASALLCTLAIFSELFKIPLSRNIFMVKWTWYVRAFWMAAYGLCVFVSVQLMHKTAAQDVGTVLATGRAAEQQTASLDNKVGKLDQEIEEARSRVVPGIKKTIEELKADLAKVGREALNTRERQLTVEDLKSATLNAQLQEKVTRLTAERSKTLTERQNTLPDRSVNTIVQTVQTVHEHMDKVSWALPLVLELAICLGAMLDVRYNRELESRPAADEATSLSMSVQTTSAHREQSAVRADNEGNFDTWLRREWENGRGEDGWLQSVQRDWARRSGVSHGYVNARLKQLEAGGVIELKTHPKWTRIRFVAVQRPALRVVGG